MSHNFKNNNDLDKTKTESEHLSRAAIQGRLAHAAPVAFDRERTLEKVDALAGHTQQDRARSNRESQT